MPVQLTYTDSVARAVAGMIAEGPDQARHIVTRLATVAIEPGLVLTKTASQKSGVEYPNAAGDLLLQYAAGVAVWSTGQIPSLLTGTHLYEAKDAVPVMEDGYIYIQAETAMVEGVPAFVRRVAAGAEKLGAIRNDADGTDATQVNWIIPMETTTGPGLCKCYVNVRAAAAA